MEKSSSTYGLFVVYSNNKKDIERLDADIPFYRKWNSENDTYLCCIRKEDVEKLREKSELGLDKDFNISKYSPKDKSSGMKEGLTYVFFVKKDDQEFVENALSKLSGKFINEGSYKFIYPEGKDYFFIEFQSTKNEAPRFLMKSLKNLLDGMYYKYGDEQRRLNLRWAAFNVLQKIKNK